MCVHLSVVCLFDSFVLTFVCSFFGVNDTNMVGETMKMNGVMFLVMRLNSDEKIEVRV